jgi:hypothetical protein
MRSSAQSANEMGLARAGLAMKQQDARVLTRSAAIADCGQNIGKLASGSRVDLFHIDGIGPPNIVFPRDRMLKDRMHRVGSVRQFRLWTH